MEYVNVDHYISSFPEHVQGTLGNLRKTIAQNAPRATEHMVGGTPVYKTKGNVLVCFSVEKEKVVVQFAPERFTEYPTEIPVHGTPKDAVALKAGKPVQYSLIGQVINHWYKQYS